MSKFKRVEYGNGHRYFYEDKPMTGVTTILGVIAKPALIPWAAKMTANYIREHCEQNVEGVYSVSEEALTEATKEHNTRKTKAGDFGTIVHDNIESYVKASIETNDGVPLAQFDFDTKAITDLTPSQIERVKIVLAEFVEWAISNVSTFVESETSLYSVNNWYAGTVDILYRDLEDNLWVADVKTSGRVYPEHFAQMGGYDIAYEEMNGKQDVYGYLVIRLDKEKGDMELVGFNDTQSCRDFFMHALNLYRSVNNLVIPN